MTDISKEAVDALLQGVTEGPWLAESGHVQSNGQLYWQVTDGYHAVVQNQFCWCQGDHAANARFIAAARGLVPALRAALDEAEAALKTVLDRESAAYARHDAALAKAEAERDTANALLRETELHLAKISGFWFDSFPRKEIRTHLGAKP